MQWVLEAFRRWLGIHEYRPSASPAKTDALPHALVRTPTWYGARGNGHAPGLVDAQPAARRLIDQLAEQHRAIRQMLEDARRMGGA